MLDKIQLHTILHPFPMKHNRADVTVMIDSLLTYLYCRLIDQIITVPPHHPSEVVPNDPEQQTSMRICSPNLELVLKLSGLQNIITLKAFIKLFHSIHLVNDSRIKSMLHRTCSNGSASRGPGAVRPFTSPTRAPLQGLKKPLGKMLFPKCEFANSHRSSTLSGGGGRVLPPR